jgi:hypothetical protein
LKKLSTFILGVVSQLTVSGRWKNYDLSKLREAATQPHCANTPEDLLLPYENRLATKYFSAVLFAVG